MFVRSSLLRLLLALWVGSAVVATASFSTTPSVAFADDDEDDEDEDDDDDDDDEDEDDDDDDDDEDDGYEQPPVTAGGLYTKKTYPVAELSRTLTVIGGMLEVRAGLDIDASNQTAFENWSGVIEGRYGIKDNFELQLGTSFLLIGDAFPGPGGTNQVRFDIGFENAIYFDVVDFRMGLELPINPECSDDDTLGCDAFAVDLAFGFPVRYRAHKQFAIIALDKLMTIHFADQKPDLTLGIGFVVQIVKQLAIVARGELFVAEFNFDEGLAIPATAALQFSPHNRFDLGLEFTFSNLKAKDETGDSAPFDARRLLIFGQARF